MVQDRLHKRFRNPTTPKLGDHEHIGQISNHRPVSNDSRECDLPPTGIGRKAQGVPNRALNRVATAAFGPVRIAQRCGLQTAGLDFRWYSHRRDGQAAGHRFPGCDDFACSAQREVTDGFY